MPELAAHLERAKELVNHILEFLDEGQLAEWAPIAQEAMVNPVAAALAACAREARYQEANAAYWCWKLSHEDFGANQQKRLDELRKDG